MSTRSRSPRRTPQERIAARVARRQRGDRERANRELAARMRAEGDAAEMFEFWRRLGARHMPTISYRHD